MKTRQKKRMRLMAWFLVLLMSVPALRTEAKTPANQFNVMIYNAYGTRYEQLIGGSGVSFSEKAITVIFGKSGCYNCDSMLEAAAAVKRNGGSVKILYVNAFTEDNSYLAEKRAQYPEVEFIDFRSDNRLSAWNIAWEEGLTMESGSLMTPLTLVIPNDANRYPTYESAGYDVLDYKRALQQIAGGSELPLTALSLDRSSATIRVGETLQLKAIVSPSNATDKNIYWYSFQDNIATVSDKGLVTALREGVTTIQAVANDGTYLSANCVVTVTASSGGNSDDTLFTPGWKRSGNKWWYRRTDGTVPKNCWESIGGIWYRFDRDGWMLTGWQKSGAKWYYLKSNGAMATGWQKVGAKWYYLEPASGAMITGWKQISGKWYYMDSSGAMVTGWVKSGSKWYYMDGSGAMATGWRNVGGKWYFLDGGGVMVSGTSRMIGGKLYWFDEKGACTNP